MRNLFLFLKISAHDFVISRNFGPSQVFNCAHYLLYLHTVIILLSREKAEYTFTATLELWKMGAIANFGWIQN